jgi:hypothetical protein
MLDRRLDDVLPIVFLGSTPSRRSLLPVRWAKTLSSNHA